MFKKIPVFAGLVAAALCGAYAVDNRSLASAGGASATTQTPTADAQTAKAVTAANAFLASLSEAQKKAALFAFTDATQRVHWSNFPTGAVTRSGVRWGELSAAQRTALMNLLGTVLSPEGVTMVKEQMDADDIVKSTSASSASNGRPAVNFGSDYYFVSFVGTPSTSSPWMLQFGGHHLAINATVVGPNIALSPTLNGGEPLKYTKDGKAIYIVEDEVKQSFAMLGSLDATQRTKAVISAKTIDLVLGPGQDGKTLQPEGLPGSAMTAAQKTQFLALIKARMSILNADDPAPKMADIQKNLEKTYFAWYGPTTTGSAAYYRVTGPTVIIEFAPQANDGDATDHAHNMYRDPTNEYGAAWTSLK
jgi:hypothetical protein